MKVALVHDYLRDYGGAERVLEALHQLFPDAPVYVAFYDPKALGEHAQRFFGWDIRESWLTRIPFYRRLFSPLRVFAPKYFQAFDLSEYDLVISSSNAYFAKAVNVDPAKHICYCHTPPRSLWGYSTRTNWQSNPLTKVAGAIINHYLRVIDVEVSIKLRHIIANSQETQRRIKHFYHQPSTVIYPPIVTQHGSAFVKNKPKQAQKSLANGYYLFVSRLAFSKHPQLAIQACNQRKLPLKVAGDGPLLGQLKEMAGPTVEVLGGVTDEQLFKLYQGARALLYPVEDEDFGMVPIEALSFGTPVIAHASGGPLETITDEVGVKFTQLTTSGLLAGIREFEQKKFDPISLSRYAETFSKSTFQQNILNYIKDKVE